jgi:hypothetical protein
VSEDTSKKKFESPDNGPEVQSYNILRISISSIMHGTYSKFPEDGPKLPAIFDPFTGNEDRELDIIWSLPFGVWS